MQEKTHKKNSKTEKSIRRAFSELINEKPVDKISVSDIIRRSDVCRGTFYAHYDDVNDLYGILKQDIVASFRYALDNIGMKSFLENPAPTIEAGIDWLMRDYEYHKNLFISPLAKEIWRYISDELKNDVVAQVGEYLGLDNPEKIRVFDVFLATSIRDTLALWFSGALSELPRDEFVALLTTLVRSAVSAYSV